MNNAPETERLIQIFLEGKLERPLRSVSNHAMYDKGVLGYSTQYLCHDACHDLSIALAVMFNHDSILILKDEAGFPVHSALFLEKNGTAIDGDGVHTKEQLISTWSNKISQKVTAQIDTVEFLSFFSDVDQDSYLEVIVEFEKIACFVNTQLSKKNSFDAPLPS